MSAFMCSPELIRRVACVLDGFHDQRVRADIFARLWKLNRDAIATRYGEADAAEIGDAPEWVETWESVPGFGLHPLSPSADRLRFVNLLRACECFAYQCSESKELDALVEFMGVNQAITNLRSQLLNTVPEYAASGWGG